MLLVVVLACSGREAPASAAPSAGRAGSSAADAAAPAAAGSLEAAGRLASFPAAGAGRDSAAGSGKLEGAGGSGVGGGRAGQAGVAGSGGMSGTASSGGTSGTASTGTAGAVAGVVAPGDLIAAPDGKANAPGTLAAPTTLSSALTRIAGGHTVFLRGGSYAFSVQLTIERDNSGSEAQQKQLAAYANEQPVLDFSGQPYGTGSNPRGLQINGSYWHVHGLDIRGSADNGVYVAGNHNIVERCVMHGNRDTGLQIGRADSSQSQQADWPSDNLILNCEAYDNYDSPPGAGENADGFAAKLTVGPGNVFRGCVSHHNIDDGWDLYTKTDTGPIGAVTIDQCVAHHNGTLTDGTTNANGDRNGFKLGGEKIAVAHVVTRSVAFANGKNGFTWNSNPGAIRLSNALSFDNVAGNYSFGDSSTPTLAVFTNDVSFYTGGTAHSDKTLGTDTASSNCWWSTSGSSGSQNAKGLRVSAADFAHSLANPTLTRAADGSLDLTVFALAQGSDLIDAGVVPPGGLPFDVAYYRGLPDLGAVETP